MAKIIPFRRPKKKKSPTRKKGQPSDLTRQRLAEALRELLQAEAGELSAGRNTSVAEIYEMEDRVHLRVMLPDQRKEDLRLGLSASSLRVKLMLESGEKTLHNIPLPFRVESETAIASYVDGCLEVQLVKAGEKPADEKSIPVT